IGLALFLRSAVALGWGSHLQSYRIPISRALTVGGIRITRTDLLIVATVLAVTVAFFLMLHRTRIGIEMRAVADLPDLARVTGIDSRRVIRWMWIVTGALAGLGGVLLGAKNVLTPNIGWFLLLPAFAATILGGIGNPVG